MFAMRGLLFLCIGGFAAIGVRLSGTQVNDKSRSVLPVVPQVAKEVQPLITEHLATAEKITLEALKKGETMPALGKFKVREKAFTDPWGALGDLEGWALGLLANTGFEHGMPDLLHRLGRWHHDKAEHIQIFFRPISYESFDDLVTKRIIPIFDAAKQA